MIIARILMLLAAVLITVEPVMAQQAAAVPAVAAVATPQADVAAEDYKPQDKDERGLWMEMDEAERNLKVSPLVMRDARLNSYVRSVLCRIVGDVKCGKVRIYVMRTAEFNATMAPNGVLVIWSGLLLRTRNEAQLAAVLGHEYTHFQKKHSLKMFREAKSKSASMVWLSFLVGGLLASLMILPGLFKYSRDMEHEADIGGLALMSHAGYDTREAAKIWEQLREEMDATALARNVKSKKDKGQGMFETHPPSAERVKYLTEAAVTDPGTPGSNGALAYGQVMAGYWPLFIDDQFKKNDFGASDYLVTALAKDGWTDWLHFARGELYRRRAADGDLDKATGFYSEGITAGSTLPDLWRGRGLAELKLGKTGEGQQDLREYIKLAPNAPDKAMIAMMAGGLQ